jgi:predicted peroxiredoxin
MKEVILENNRKILIVQLSDPEKEPEKCIAGLIFARTLVVMEQNIFIFSMAKSPLLYTKDLHKNKHINQKFKDLISENLNELLKNPVTIHICSKSKELLQLEADMLIKPFQISGMVTLHNLKISSDHAYFF